MASFIISYSYVIMIAIFSKLFKTMESFNFDHQILERHVASGGGGGGALFLAANICLNFTYIKLN